jgi:hypothetical protein
VRHGTASFEIEPPDEAEMARRQCVLLEGGYPYLVAENEGTLLGYAYAGPYRARPAYHWSVENSIYVEPRAHRGGFRQMIAVIGVQPNCRPSRCIARSASAWSARSSMSASSSIAGLIPC